jgi:hypothetical protein
MRKVASALALCLAGSVVAVPSAHAQGRGGGTWSTVGGDPQLSGFQKTEPRLTRDNIKAAKFLWKIKLGTAEVTQPTEPLFAGHTITNAGFKDMVVVYGPNNTLTNVDYELGIVLWQRRVSGETAKPSASCANAQFSAATVQPAATFAGGGAARGAAGARGAAPIPTGPPPNPVPGVIRVGGNLAGGVGFGGLRGIFVQTADGNLHEQELNNGWDYGQAVKFTPPGANLGSPLIVGSTIYSTAGGCGASASGAYALDMKTDAYQKASYETGSVAVTGTDGPALSADEKTLFITTGSGSGSGDVHANSVVAIDSKSMAIQGYYTPSGADAKSNIGVSPVFFTYKGRQLVAAYVAGGRLALLDAASLGGSDHHTALALTAPLSKDGGSGSWGRLASAEDSAGTRFVYVSVRGALAADAKLPSANGAITDGALVAFKVDDEGGKLALTPAWVSPNVANPSPASIIMNAVPPNVDNFGQPLAAPANAPPPPKAGGVVFTLSQGEAGKSHAKLYGFDAETGAQVFSSGEAVESSANEASISISGAHVMFVTSDNTLYAFGIEYERN